MVKTLRITSVAAVLLAVVVLATVLGYLRPTTFVHLNFGTQGDKQVDKILEGPSAVDRFKELYGKVPTGQNTTPPLIKQAEAFASIINPPAPVAPPSPPTNPLSSRPAPSLKPPGPVSSKFDLLGTCCSSDPKASYAYIRLPDNTYQWVGVGSEIGHVTIKEVRNGAIVYWDGSRNVPMAVEPVPDTSSLLETGNAAASPTASEPQPAVGGAANLRGHAGGSGNMPSGLPRPSIASNRRAIPGASLPSAQISKEEQENLSQLGDKLRTGAGSDAAEREALANKLISQYKAEQAGSQETDNSASPGTQSNDNEKFSRDRLRMESRRQWQKRLALPRPMPK